MGYMLIDVRLPLLYKSLARLSRHGLRLKGNLCELSGAFSNSSVTLFSRSASNADGRGFASRFGHTKDHHKNGANCLHASHAYIRIGVYQ